MGLHRGRAGRDLDCKIIQVEGQGYTRADHTGSGHQYSIAWEASDSCLHDRRNASEVLCILNRRLGTETVMIRLDLQDPPSTFESPIRQELSFLARDISKAHGETQGAAH